MKLVMTLLVRDEEDIVAANIDYHLARGVDFIIATDNRSTDKTAQILKSYQSRGQLHYIFEERDDYDQHAWVTSMARMAFTHYSADWVINNDADEFWWPLQGNLKTTFENLPPEVNIVNAPRYNFMPVDSSSGPFWASMVYREKVSLNSLGQPLPPKVAHRGAEAVKVSQGNHSIQGFALPCIANGVIEILHFPTRNYQQIENKIIKGGAAYERNPKLPVSLGSSWRALYGEYRQHGNLRRYYEEIFYDLARLEKSLQTGELVIDRRLADYLQALVSHSHA